MKLPLTLALAMASAVLGHNSVMAADIDAQCQNLLQDAPLSVVMKDAKFIPAGPAGDDPNRMMTGASGRAQSYLHTVECAVRSIREPVRMVSTTGFSLSCAYRSSGRTECCFKAVAV